MVVSATYHWPSFLPWASIFSAFIFVDRHVAYIGVPKVFCKFDDASSRDLGPKCAKAGLLFRLAGTAGSFPTPFKTYNII